MPKFTNIPANPVDLMSRIAQVQKAVTTGEASIVKLAENVNNNKEMLPKLQAALEAIPDADRQIAISAHLEAKRAEISRLEAQYASSDATAS